MAEPAKDAIEDWIDEPELLDWARAKADELLAHFSADDPLSSMLRAIRGDEKWFQDADPASNQAGVPAKPPPLPESTSPGQEEP